MVMRVRHVLWAAALAALVTAVGPGCRGPHPYPVSGHVVYDDGETASDLVGAAVTSRKPACCNGRAFLRPTDGCHFLRLYSGGSILISVPFLTLNVSIR